MSESLNVVCGHCDSVIRVPTQRLQQQPRCPKCHRPLFEGHPIELRDVNFERHAARNDLPVIVDFWAPWCAPCRAMAPHFEAAASRFEPRARFAKVNSDDAPEVSGRFAIRSIPTLVVLHHGRESARQSGAMNSNDLEQWLTAALA